VRQPERSNCEITANGSDQKSYDPSGPSTSTGKQGMCSFNYFSHAPGLGLRYHTPVGPIRLDFSYSLNPPIFPVNIDYSLYPAKSVYSNPHVGEGGHFNFFFSLGQSY
jgi:outer membrane protein assembly factor BamA